MTYGFTCFGCGVSIDFDDLPSDPSDACRAAEYLAGLQGWAIGHWDGQGHIVCGDCHGAVWDAIVFKLPYRSETMPWSPSLIAWFKERGIIEVSSSAWTGRPFPGWSPYVALSRAWASRLWPKGWKPDDPQSWLRRIGLVGYRLIYG